MLKKIVISVLLSHIFNLAYADTIWCKMFKAGCITEEQKQKQFRHCEQMGNEAYDENLSKALADPTVWQYSGEKSPYSYAAMTKRGMVATCLKMTTPQNY